MVKGVGARRLTVATRGMKQLTGAKGVVMKLREDKVRWRINGRGGRENDKDRVETTSKKKTKNQPERKERKREREKEKDVGRHRERKKERTTRVGRKIEKDCHARHSGGDESGGVTWSSVEQGGREREREGERAKGENGDRTRVARRG